MGKIKLEIIFVEMFLDNNNFINTTVEIILFNLVSLKRFSYF